MIVKASNLNFLHPLKVSDNGGNATARFTTSLRNPSMSSSLSRNFPDFSNLELLVAEALEEELEQKIEFSINRGDEVFQDVQPRMEIQTSCMVDGVLKTTTEPATTTADLNAVQNFPGFFTPVSSSADLSGIHKIFSGNHLHKANDFSRSHL